MHEGRGSMPLGSREERRNARARPEPAGSHPVGPATSMHELSDRQVVATLAGVMLALLLAALDQTIVGTALPRVVAELRGFEQYAWVVTAYLLTSTATVPIVGKLSDLFGRKRFLLVGVAVFVLASALSGAAQTMTQLVVFRGVQGIGAGMTQAMAFTTIADLFPPARRGRVSGLFAAVFGVSSVIGPTVGGFLTDGPGWRWVFYVNLPLGVLSFGVLLFFFPQVRSVRTTRPRIDVLGALTLVLAVVPILLALSWGGREYAWGSPLVIGLLLVGGTMTLAFLWAEQRAVEPIIPLGLYRSSIVSVSTAAAALTSVGLFGTVLFIPLFIQSVIGTTATQSGAVLTPMMLAFVGSSLVAGQIMTRAGRYRALAVAGTGTAALGMALLSGMGADTDYTTVVRNMVVVGLGLGVTMPVFTLAVQNAVEPRFTGTATSGIQFFRSMGGALGSAVFGSLLASRFPAAFRAALPADIARALPSEQLARFDNPQALVSPEASSGLQQGLAALDPPAQGLVAALQAAVRTGLASALHDVFALGALIVAVAAVATLFLREVPLRASHYPAGGSAGARAESRPERPVEARAGDGPPALRGGARG